MGRTQTRGPAGTTMPGIGALAALTLAATLVTAAPALAADDCSVTIGRVVPMTGPLALMGKLTPWIDEHKTKLVNDAGGLTIGDKTCEVKFNIYDSQSTVPGSIDAASRAILQDKVDILLLSYAVAGSDICERYGTPCLTTQVPVEPWLYGPDGKPRSYKSTFHAFFKVADLVKSHIAMVRASGDFNGNVGYLYPNDADGVVFQSIFDPAIKEAGWTPVDPGRFAEGLPDYSTIINKFKRNNVEVVMGVLSPPDLQNYLQQAAQAGFKPKAYVIDKATIFEELMQAIGPTGNGILNVNPWSPAFPGTSAFGGWTGQELATALTTEQPDLTSSPSLGYTDALYDIAFDALQRAGTTAAPEVIKALEATDLETVVGPVKFNAEHYSAQPLGGAQWQYAQETGKWAYENVFNEVFPTVAKTAEMIPYQP